jgi:hypothetical protein
LLATNIKHQDKKSPEGIIFLALLACVCAGSILYFQKQEPYIERIYEQKLTRFTNFDPLTNVK